MKNTVKRTISAVGLILYIFLLSGCDKGFDEVNTNPNVPTAEAIPVDNLFLGILTDVADETNDETMLIISDLFGFAFPSGVAAYEVGTADKWDDLYVGIKNINELLKITAEDGREPHAINHSVARILRVIYYQRLVDLFGAIPYTEGGQGLLYPQPKYDSAETVYKAMVEELSIAYNTIKDNTGGAFSPGVDLVYGSDARQWAKFANSLKFRLGMRMRFVDEALAKKIIAECLGADLMSSNADSWAFVYTGTEGSNSNDLFSTNRPNRFVSELLMSQMRECVDPRIAAYGDPAGVKGDFYQGQVNGLNMNFDDGAQSTYSVQIWSNRSFPAYLMTYAELCFLKAEAALINDGDANVEYQKGIRASMEQWGVSSASTEAYMATDEAKLVKVEGESIQQQEERHLKKIAYQKWIALYTNGHEAYAEMRRTGYPHIEQRVEEKDIQRIDPQGNLVTVTVGYRLGITEGVFPRRVEYPNSERNLNPDNLNEVIEKYGDGLLDKIWWDVGRTPQ
ncbi:MAG: SusD/RagB family nutrient-binding outer membrane lipoprotein [Marinilabiliaceae bacterium]|nr:SusD/RagB family nutrient-binding outer membrane lipoprotein [Marinilabiliaceae bacterium]